MKHLLTTVLTFSTIAVCGQDYPFIKKFVKGTIVFKDSTVQVGQIKWFPHQHEKLAFRENENADTKKYSPEELMGFTTDSLHFVSLFDLEVYSDNYALLGKTSKIKHSFAQLLDSGSYNIYFVLITGYDAISGGIQAYPNFYFEKKEGNHYLYAAYPFAVRMKKSRYENAKENLYVFFKDYPQILEKIKSCKPQNDFLEIIHLMKQAN